VTTRPDRYATLPCGCQEGTDPSRRRVLQAGAAVLAGLTPGIGRAEDQDASRMMRPQPGDLLVRVESDQAGQVITAAEVKRGEPPILAWAMDPATKVSRDGSRLNQVLLLRLDPAALGPITQPHAADGLVAYSAICTHAQCPVTGWIEDKQVLHCPCHQSEYDPAHDAKVVSGPAPRPLAALPLKIKDGKPEVAGGFIGKVGMSQPTM
jgi:rieske iron-sulfur protein